MAVANIGSEAWCRKAYLNYHCYGNTMGLTPADMGEITNAWSDRLSSWQNSVSNDETEYEFDDSDYAMYIQDGVDAAKEASGHDGKQGGQITRTVGDSLSGTVGALGETIGTNVATTVAKAVGGKFLGTVMKKAGKAIAKKAADKALEKAAEKGVEKATTEAAQQAAQQAAQKAAQKAGEDAAKKATKNIGWIITAPLALATGIAYMAKKPNKDEVDACNALQAQMTSSQDLLTSTQEDMEGYNSELQELGDLATTYNEDTNKKLEEQKTEYDMFLQTLMNIQAKIDSGEPLTESEKELYKSVVGYLQEIGINIEELTDKTTEEIQAIFEEMGIYQDGFDEAAQSMGETEGLTDFAESLDKSTRIMCFVEAAAQGLNAVSGGKAAYQAGSFALSGGWFTAWAWAFAAMGTAGAAMSATGAVQQIKWAGEVGTEIEMRGATQDLNTETMGVYEEQLDYYAGYLEGVEDLELEIPDDVAPPEDVTVPTGTPATQGEETPTPTGDDPNKKPKTGTQNQ